MAERGTGPGLQAAKRGLVEAARQKKRGRVARIEQAMEEEAEMRERAEKRRRGASRTEMEDMEDRVDVEEGLEEEEEERKAGRRKKPSKRDRREQALMEVRMKDGLGGADMADGELIEDQVGTLRREKNRCGPRPQDALL
jgi:hypothetical protein